MPTGPIANPIVLVDEIEKADGEGRYNPTAALYSLLEKTSAREFQDLSLRDFPIDASHVNWVAASNLAEYLDPPIRSRFTVVQVPAPTPAQTRSIHVAMFEDMRFEEAWGSCFDALPEATLDALEGIGPREAKNLLRLGAGNALIEQRSVVLPEDFRKFIPRRRLAANFVQETVRV